MAFYEAIRTRWCVIMAPYRGKAISGCCTRPPRAFVPLDPRYDVPRIRPFLSPLISQLLAPFRPPRLVVVVTRVISPSFRIIARNSSLENAFEREHVKRGPWKEGRGKRRGKASFTFRSLHPTDISPAIDTMIELRLLSGSRAFRHKSNPRLYRAFIFYRSYK